MNLGKFPSCVVKKKMHLYKRHVGTARPLMKEVSRMPQHKSYSTYMQKGPTNWRTKLSDPKVLSHSDYVGLPLKIKNHPKNRIFKIDSSFPYINQYGCCKRACLLQVFSHWEFTLERNESSISVEQNLTKIKQYYFLTLHIRKATRKSYQSNTSKFLEASLTKQKLTKIRSQQLKLHDFHGTTKCKHTSGAWMH